MAKNNKEPLLPNNQSSLKPWNLGFAYFNAIISILFLSLFVLSKGLEGLVFGVIFIIYLYQAIRNITMKRPDLPSARRWLILMVILSQIWIVPIIYFDRRYT